MITRENVVATFGTKMKAAKAIGISRPGLDHWIKEGKIPKYCAKGRGNSSQRDWVEILTEKGIDPDTLTYFDKPIDKHNEKMVSLGVNPETLKPL